MIDGNGDIERLIAAWLDTALLVRIDGRTIDLDAVAREAWDRSIAPLRSPVTLVTGWNPGGRQAVSARNRAANRRLRTALDRSGCTWRPALGRARDGSWAEPGFAIGGLTAKAAAALGARWGQLATYVISVAEVAVLSSDGTFLRRRPRGR